MITKYGNKYFNDVNGDVSEDEPEPGYICENCGAGIFKGETFFRVDDREFCWACARQSCGDILKRLGGEVHEINLPVCESCQSEIQGKYIIFRERNYCEGCLTDYGEELLEELFGKPETAEEPEKWWGD